MCEEVTESAGPVLAPVLHVYFALIGPVVLCFPVWVSFSPVCVWAKLVPTCVSDVGESDDLEIFPTPVHLVMELVVFGEVGFECAHDGDVVFSL